jgi:GNAT superfamily N-acetyltransferase
MTFEIRDAAPRDVKEIGFVHWKSWIDTYTGLINPTFLESLSAQKSAARFKELGVANMLVLTADGTVVGFSVSGRSKDDDLPDSCGDIHAIDILKDYHKLGYGRKLLEASLEKLRREGFDMVSAWLLEDNKNAAAFYMKCGFVPDGRKKEVIYTTPVMCVRYILRK